MNNDNILLRHNYISVPAGDGSNSASQEVVATILMNLSYYGKALSVESYKALTKADASSLADWWQVIEHELKDISGDSRKIGNFVVYKNFPKEVLDKTTADYWVPQLLMYWGFPNEFFTEEVKARPAIAKTETKQPLVLKLAKKGTLGDLFTSLLKSPARWKNEEWLDVLHLSSDLPVNLAKLAFKENLVKLAVYFMEHGRKISIGTATDVLRLAAGLSDGDVALRDKFHFKSFKKPVRRYMLSLLESCGNLTEDVARRPELFKRLLHNLHPGDYKRAYPRVWDVNNDLYKDRLETFNAKVENYLREKNPAVLPLLATRPGEFRRRLVHTLDLFGTKAAKAFIAPAVLDKLTVNQVVALRTYLETANERLNRTFPPKGNWNKMQIGEARWVEDRLVKMISKALGKVLATRVPKVGLLDDATALIKLPSNDSEVSPYARGTVFPIPSNVDFIRMASYWKIQSRGYVWFDNGVNFFDTNWKSQGSCCWITPFYPGTRASWSSLNDRRGHKDAAAVFSGDPTNSKEMQGRAAQMIDLYPEKLKALGIRYAVWNILCYSRLAFSEAEDVFAALQWGTGATTGKLFEPSRCQLALPLHGESLTKYVCVMDFETMEMTYIDANLHGNTQSAASNEKHLEKNMPPFMEYIKSLPSVHDLFRESVDDSSDTHVLYSDKDAKLDGETAYVFQPEKKDNVYKPLDINGLLG